MRPPLVSVSRIVIAVFVLAAGLGFGCGGSSSSSLGVQFTQSATPQSARLVKLVKKSSSGTHVVVDAVIYGPDTTLDMYSFAFDVKIGDPNVLRFVNGSGTAGNALVAFAGQSVQAQADLGQLPGGGGTDNSTVVVGVSKLGGGVGNGISGSSAVVVELTFAVQMAGSTTLTIAGSPAPRCLDSGGLTIGSITFDAASATVKGVSTGGGGY